MIRWLNPRFLTTLLALGLASVVAGAQDSTPPPGAIQPNVLYGAAYYNEYMPADLQPGRLEKDVALMKEAGISVVRMGESTWSLWEPSDGVFEYAWMDRVVDAMGKAGIKVIMGTPTYSMPTWMAKAHPEFYARPLGGASIGYGMRQNMDTDNPKFRFYAERVITNLVSHYRDNPAVIGWQIDNETGSYGASNEDVFSGFVNHLKKKFGTIDALNKAWLLNYWGQDVNDWADMPTRDNATSTSYKLEWSRWQQMRVADFLAFQAALVRKYRRPRPVRNSGLRLHDGLDVNEVEVAKSLDVVANNPYHGTQDHMDGAWQALQGDFARSLKHQNFLVTETNAQTLGWDSAGQYPPYDGQLRLDVYTDLSSGADMVEYWHWHSIHAGPGNLLEGRAQPRSRTEPRLRRSFTYRARAAEGRPRDRQPADSQSGGDPLQRRFIERASASCLSNAKSSDGRPARPQAPTTLSSRSCTVLFIKPTWVRTSSFPRLPTSRNTSCSSFQRSMLPMMPCCRRSPTMFTAAATFS